MVTSVREGYGIVVIEANACGTPAAGWRNPGLKDSNIDGETGVLVSFGNIESLGKAITTLLKDSTVRERMASSAVRWAGTHPWEEAAANFAKVIESVA